MKKRIFFALSISEIFKEKIEKWKGEFKGAQPGVFRKIRWMPPENLHITLIPPFYKDEDKIKEVPEIISSIEGKVGEFKLNFEEISFGPTVFHPRLVWISGETNKVTKDLKEGIEEILKLPQDNRQFSPHITIGRFREKDFRSFQLKTLDVPFIYIEKFEEFLLMESKTLPKGAVYNVLGKFKN